MAIGRSITGEGETLPELLYHPISVVDLTPPNIFIEQVIIDRKEEAITIRQLIRNSNLILVLAIIFHFMRADDINK